MQDACMLVVVWLEMVGSLLETEGQLFASPAHNVLSTNASLGEELIATQTWHACLGSVVHLMPVYATATLIL